jgi:hypothetical protein
MPLRRQRIVVVKRGAIELFERLRARFADDPDTAVIWDRRTGRERRNGALDVPVERRRGDRRYPNDHVALLAGRGFFVVHPLRHRAGVTSVGPPGG